MYANEAAVRSLIKNKRSTTALADIQAAASFVDSEIDAALMASHFWPMTPNGDDLSTAPPDQIVQIANLLTAALIEAEAYAMNEAGQAMPNPYATKLEKRGYGLLERITCGRDRVMSLIPKQLIASAPQASIYSPVSALRSTQGAFRNRR